MRRILDRHPGLAIAASLLAGAVLAGAPARAGPRSPAAAQPTLPPAAPAATTKPSSPVVESIVGKPRTPLEVHKHAAHARKAPRRHLVRRGHVRGGHVPMDLERPALAGVELLLPLPPPGEPPHIVVPLPAYPLETLAASFTTPPPPIFCHPTRRDPNLPDPRLYREVTVACEPDNP